MDNLAKLNYTRGETIKFSGKVYDEDDGEKVTIYRREKWEGTVTYVELSGTWENFLHEYTVGANEEEGEHIVYYYAVDSTGLRSDEIMMKYNVILDTGPPTGSHTLSPDVWTSNNVTITVTATDDTGINRIKLPTGSYVNSNIATYTVSSNGEYKFVLEDTYGNTTDYSINVSNIDKLKPTASVSPNGGSKYVMPTSGNAKITTTISASDADATTTNGKSGLKTVQYAWSQSNTSEPGSGWTNFTASGQTITKSDISGAGTWYLWTKVIDNADNRAESIKVSNGFTIISNNDERAKITLTPDITIWTNTNVVVTAAYGEFLSQNRTLTCDGTVNTNYTINTSNIASGTATATVKTNERTVTATAEDIAGNKITKTYKVSNIDKLRPSTSVSPNGGSKYVMPTSGNAKIITTLSAGDADANADNGRSGLMTVQYAWSQSNSSEPGSGWTNFTASGQTITKSDISQPGTWYLWTKVIDNAGNRAESIKVSNGFTIISNNDERAKITLTPDITVWTNTNVVVTATYGEFLTQNKTLTCDGTANVDYTVNGLVNVVVKNNEKTVTATAEDIAGNKIVKTYKVTNIDKIPPVENISHTPTNWVIDYVTIHWEFTDAQSGMDYVELPNGTTTRETSGTYVVYDNGDYNFAGHDIAGNVKRVTQTIINIDKINPEGVLSLSTRDLTDMSIKINWQAVDHESGFSKILLPDATISNNPNGSFDVSRMGTYTFIIYDRVGNEKELSIEVNNVDMESPRLTVTQNVTRWTNEDIDLYWKAIDYQSGLKEVILPNSDQIREQSEGNYTATQNGIYTFLAYDKIGNGVLVKHEVTNIDKTAPLLILKTIPNDNGNIDIIWEASDYQSGIRNIILPDGQSTSESTGRYETTQNGTYTFLAYDKVGNDVFMKIDVNSLDTQGIEFEIWQEETNNDSYKICWKIHEGQEDYKYILLPDNTYSEKEEGYFITKEEGEYTFQSYDRAGNEIIKSIKIKNIDRIYQSLYNFRNFRKIT